MRKTRNLVPSGASVQIRPTSCHKHTLSSNGIFFLHFSSLQQIILLEGMLPFFVCSRCSGKARGHGFDKTFSPPWPPMPWLKLRGLFTPPPSQPPPNSPPP